MTLTVEATYENGMLRLAHPLPLQQDEKVQITVHTTISRADLSAGLLRWNGAPEALRQLAEDDEFGVLESP